MSALLAIGLLALVATIAIMLFDVAALKDRVAELERRLGHNQ